MSCCGKQRQQFQGAIQLPRTHDPAERRKLQTGVKRYFVTYFEYLGKTGMTVVGPQTGKRYRFDHQGVIVAVDLKDRLSLSNIPQLRQVRAP